MTSLNDADILNKLEKNISANDEICILTYINSDNKRINLFKTMTDNQYLELCKLIINFTTSEHENESLKQSCGKLLNNLLNHSHRKINFFNLSLTFDRNKRLKLFELIKTIEDKQLTRLIEDQDTCKFLNDCLREVDAVKMEWLSPTACTDNISLLIQAEKKPSDFEDLLIYSTLEFIHRLYGYSLTNSLAIQQFHQLLLDKVVTLLYMGHKKQRTPSINLFTTALKTDIRSYIQQNHEETWTIYRSNLQNVYCTRMLSLVKASEPDWWFQWCLSIQALGTDLHRGADLINILLSVEERAFKSPDMSLRIQAFRAWKLLIENFALDPTQLAIPRRIKLLCIPLNANNNKTESIALAKFEVWRYLIIKLCSKPDKSLTQVVTQFLNFCFGPLGDTPLLSTKSGIQSSPGKRFIKARKWAVDSLLQLLVSNPQERLAVTVDYKENIPAITQELFQESFKSYIHSAGEACLLINDSECVFENRKTLNRILWQSLVGLINQSTDELKAKMYRELILIIGEVINHIKVRDELTSSLLLDIIVPELVKVIEHLLYRDQTLMDLLVKLLDPEFLTHGNGGLKSLIVHAIKPEAVTSYHPASLPFIRSITRQMESLTSNENLSSFIIELWSELADLLVKFISSNQSINEGTALAHNFDTTYSLLLFPVKSKWINEQDVNYLVKISRIWKELYAHFNIAADLVATVKNNEVLDHVADALLALISSQGAEKFSYRFVCFIFEALMNTIHYADFLALEEVPSLLLLLRDVTQAALEQVTHVSEIECSLKTMASLLITVYGLNQSQARVHLSVLRPCVESMLKINTECIKEIVTTWETVVIILRGLSGSLTCEFVSSYREALDVALCHPNHEIAAQTMSFLDIRSSCGDEIKRILDEVEAEAQKNVNCSGGKSDETEKRPVKVAGSFLARRSGVKAGKKGKEKRVAPVPPEPDSQDYVLIQNDVKVNVNLLTEHQKECFKRRRDDIPAMYNDLSQSGSRNTQELEEWFKNKAGGSTEATDDNKENKLREEAVKESEETLVDKTEELSPDVGDKIDEPVSVCAVKKLNFESRDEFPDENENTQEKDLTKSEMRLNRRKPSRVTRIYAKERREDARESRESDGRRDGRSKRGRRRGGRSRLSTERENLKRKADSEEFADVKRRRHSAPHPADLQSDTESFCSNDSEKSSPTDGSSGSGSVNRTGVSQRTRKEMSRLKIDMVFDSQNKSKLRNKSSDEQRKNSDDFVYEKMNKRHSLDPYKLMRKTTRSSGDAMLVEQQSLGQVRRKRKRDLGAKDSDKNQGQEDFKFRSPLSSPSTSTTSNSTAERQDDDDVIESSQDLCSVRSPRRDKKIDMTCSQVSASPIKCEAPGPASPVTADPSPIKSESPVKPTSPVKVTVFPVKLPSPVKSSLEDTTEVIKETVDESKTINYSSPKSVKRLAKVKLFTPGRGAHMLGLVTKLGIPDSNEPDEDKMSRVTKPKETELEAIKKERVKDIGSPSGSRQEKIFSNMKSGDYLLSPPTKLFSNLKNDGEKISPKMEKTKDVGKTDHDYAELKEVDDLPILEWSNANPPSLTASPSAGILKRRAASLSTANVTNNVNNTAGNSLAEEPGNEKRKRVSFADPPVSKEMGYEVLSGSPAKLNKLLISRSFPGRKDTPYKLKQSRLRTILMEDLKPKEVQVQDKGLEVHVDGLFDVNIEDKDQETVEVSIASQDIFQQEEISIIDVGKKDDSVVEEFATQDSTIERIINGTISDRVIGDGNVNEALEDTVDVQNISNFTADESIYKPVRTSTVEKINASDTLLITDSLFESRSQSQSSESEFQDQSRSQMEMTDPICPTLLGCMEPIDSIVDSLVHPLWSKNLSKLLSSRNINTVGDLAALSHDEYEKLPLKGTGSPKVEHVRRVLTDFSMSLSMPMEKSTGKCDSEELMDVDADEAQKIDRVELIEDVATPAYDQEDLNITEVLTDKIRVTQGQEFGGENPDTSSSNGFGSIILDSTLSPPKKSSTGINSGLMRSVDTRDVGVSTDPVDTNSKSVDVQMKLEDLLDEIDVNVVLASGIKRSCPENIIKAYKAKMMNKNDTDIGRETMRLLGMETYADTCLKIACRDYGASKIIGRLPGIFSNDKEFFTKVLNTYRMKLTTTDLLNVSDTDNMKQEFCKKLTSAELCEMLSRVLADEEKDDVKTQINDETCLNSLLKRMPADSVISHTVANDELIPPPVVLDIALQNNSPEVIAAALDTDSNINNNIKEAIINKYLTPDKLITYLNNKQTEISKQQFIDIYRFICDKFSIDELLDINNDIIKDKFKQLK
ncbi:telomere-associated protein RIF1 [Microplitis mediator]|uniref:telomere-associated protein RIF1 n=1 Tax=Microplitis mediator TaxID=375433 RepID=UPI0025532285|nr:telomere-associated protein RIF1 [Microplitis mediator]XP_057335682.1 telomere-associated protein RIF1 [Microplitis mediator]XP_057335683.1 telomere-associated protein RIF1 [Microplitis mediator]